MGRLIMVLKSYFDGGNQDDSTQYDVVSLACVAAIDVDWQPFETPWRILLQRYFGDRQPEAYLHTVDAVTGNGVYKGWGIEKTQDFLSDCAKLATEYFIKAKKPDAGFPGRYGLYGCITTINLKDFIEHTHSHPEFPQNANEILFRQALSMVMEWSRLGANPPCDECHFIFDQGEPFYGHLDDILTRKKSLKDAASLAMITSRTKANMRRVPALQLADLVAWCEIHKMDTDKAQWHKSVLSLDVQREWYDRTNLWNVQPDQQAIWESWKVNKRRPTR
jgi:hypothetical protein